MQNFQDWLNESHPEFIIDEGWKDYVALGLGGMLGAGATGAGAVTAHHYLNKHLNQPAMNVNQTNNYSGIKTVTNNPTQQNINQQDQKQDVNQQDQKQNVNQQNANQQNQNADQENDKVANPYGVDYWDDTLEKLYQFHSKHMMRKGAQQVKVVQARAQNVMDADKMAQLKMIKDTGAADVQSHNYLELQQTGLKDGSVVVTAIYSSNPIPQR